MKPSKTESFAGKLTLALAIGGLMISPALAERMDHDRDHDHGREDRHEWRSYEDHRPEWRHYHYAQPVYVPPPVYYEPRQSPGITLFFPLDLRHR